MGIGTSAPEILVSLSASLTGKPTLAVGNALGSNITNLALVLGTTALITPLAVSSGILRRELPLVLAVSVMAGLFCLDRSLARWEGSLLILGFVGVLVWMFQLARAGHHDDPMIAEISAHEGDPVLPRPRALLWIAVGLILLPLSAQVLVWGATTIAEQLGVSELVIGLTVVAIGTSLPELAASLAGAARGEPDIALGNVLGSNLFNLLLVLGIPAVIAAPALEADVILRDVPVMLGLTVIVFIMAWGWRGPGKITRLEGAALLGAFVAYELILAASMNLL